MAADGETYRRFQGDCPESQLISGMDVVHPIITPRYHPAANFTTPTAESSEYTGYDFNLSSLKSIITDPTITTRIRPVLISFSGLPESGKTKAVKHIMEFYVDRTPFAPTTRKSEGLEAEGISFYELLAAGFKPLRNLCITEITQESCCTSGILSAFKNDVLKKGRIPLLDCRVQLTKEFENRDLDDHLRYIYQYLCQQESIPKGSHELDEEQKKYAENLKNVLPSGIALINIWDLNISKSVRHFLTALQGHLYNNYMWLFLDLERDMDNLDKPPIITGEGRQDGAALALMQLQWRPRLHYLLRSCRMSESKEKIKRRGRMCTIFAKHDGKHNGNLQKKIDVLEAEVRLVAKQIGVSELLAEKIKTINLEGSDDADDYSLRLYQKFQQVICETPFEEVPIAWVFLRSLFYRSDKKYISRDDLESLAKQCNMDEVSLEKFRKFYTSFGSIFDLSLVNPEYKYVIVKPIGFLKSLDKFLYPNEEMHRRYPSVKHGIFSEKAFKDLLGGDWSVYTDALVYLNLATKVTSACIQIPNDYSLDRNEMYYYISLSRTGPSVKDPDPNSVHLITSISTPHVFKQVTLTKHILGLLEQSKLVPCENMNQTIIKDEATGVTITLVSHSPATKIHLDKPNEVVCSAIVQAYNNIAESSGVPVKYKFVKICAESCIPDVQCILSARYHVLPDEVLCPKCKEAEKADAGLLKVWKKTLKDQEFSIPEKFKPTGVLKVLELAAISTDIAASIPHEIDGISIIAKTFGFSDAQHQFQKVSPDQAVMEILLFWNRKYRNEKDTRELRRALAQKISELGSELWHHCKSEHKNSLKEEFGKIAKKVDVYYVAEITEDN